MEHIQEISLKFENALLSLNKIEARQLLLNETKQDTTELINKIVIPALERIGNAWQEGMLALSQIYMSGRICEQLIDEILPPSSSKRKDQPRMGIAVLNDYHFLGKRIVYSQLRSAGYSILDYGRKTVDELVESIKKDKLEIIFISTLMYPSALSVKDLKNELMTQAPHVKIIVGGAPFNMDLELWKEVGADAMGHDAKEALICIKSLEEK